MENLVLTPLVGWRRWRDRLSPSVARHSVADVDGVARRHAFHPLRVLQVVDETDDTRSFVLEVPEDLDGVYRYRPGQFCTFRVPIGTEEHFRCYSMSSAPDVDRHLTVTVKRVPGGAVSNWFNDAVAAGDLVDTSPPSGAFCLTGADRPILGFCGGSGVTPVLSLTKSALASTGRTVRLFYASRAAHSVIFDQALTALQAGATGRLEVRRHVDAVQGLPRREDVVALVGGDPDVDCYVCGPGPFMAMVEEALLGVGVAPESILIERFESPEPPGAERADTGAATHPETIELRLKGVRHQVAYHPGDTVLETARRAGLAAPYSCESGSCATCMALVHEGSVTMRVDNALTAEEVEEGWILTCQSLPTSPTLRIEYEQL
jgi:3-ketosteroid 9alpha-monooxygenase subunit B